MKILFGPNLMGLEKAIPDLQAKYPGVTLAYCGRREDMPAMIADADVYVGGLDRDLFLAARQLKWVQSPSSGVNHYLAIPELAASNVILTSASGTHAACLADSVFGMILAFTRCIKDFVLRQQHHEWASQAFRPQMVELTGSTMGIIGLGAVGRAIAQRAVAFGMHVVAVDILPVARPDIVETLWGPEQLHELLNVSDYVVVAVPYTSATDGMIGAEEIAQMKPGALLVGISRGRIIDEDALTAALKSGHLRGAALDVFAQEPLPPDSELWDLPNVLITPHAAGGTQFEGQYVLDIFYENLDRFFRGDLPLRNQVDKQRGF
ncbi:MAG TPA: D-2-hydroxyacid dehydrogenase [Anaerolineae bacterium]|nr:D-2-hydroxyacid dehydrogenase [Anaerolineae bacterium]HQH38734.1 D-2-hydroxyacid dehydrogenase [Anaerolineae bacterium]